MWKMKEWEYTKKDMMINWFVALLVTWIGYRFLTVLLYEPVGALAVGIVLGMFLASAISIFLASFGKNKMIYIGDKN